MCNLAIHDTHPGGCRNKINGKAHVNTAVEAAAAAAGRPEAAVAAAGCEKTRVGAARRHILTGSCLSKRTPRQQRILGRLPDPAARGVGGGGRGGRGRGEGGGRQGGGRGGGGGGGASWEKGAAPLGVGTEPGAAEQPGCTASTREQRAKWTVRAGGGGEAAAAEETSADLPRSEVKT